MNQWKPTRKFWSSYKSLYSESVRDAIQLSDQTNTNVAGKKNNSNKAIKYPLEKTEQIIFSSWMKKHNVPFYHVPNGGTRGGRVIKGKWVPLEGIKMKASGVSPGVPDICIPIAKKGYHAYYIEMKRQGGSLKNVSDSQNYWIDILRHHGNLVDVAFGAEDAKKMVREYMNNAFE